MKLIQKDKWVFVPITLSSKVHRKRGYNQAEILAKKLGQKFKIKALDINKINKDVSNIFLVDDVVKTGLTLRKAAEIVKRNGVKKVFGLTLARD